MSAIVRTTQDWETDLGQRIRLARKRARLSQQALADRANVSRTAVKSLEAGKGSTLRTFINVVRALGLDTGLDRISWNNAAVYRDKDVVGAVAWQDALGVTSYAGQKEVDTKKGYVTVSLPAQTRNYDMRFTLVFLPVGGSMFDVVVGETVAPARSVAGLGTVLFLAPRKALISFVVNPSALDRYSIPNKRSAVIEIRDKNQPKNTARYQSKVRNKTITYPWTAEKSDGSVVERTIRVPKRLVETKNFETRAGIRIKGKIVWTAWQTPTNPIG